MFVRPALGPPLQIASDAKDASANKNAVQGLVGQRFRDAGPVSLPLADGAEVAYPNIDTAGDGDITALAMIVMMDAVKSAPEDLKAIMEATKALNDSKAAQRAAMCAWKQAMQDTKGDAQEDKDAARDDKEPLQDHMDSLSDRSEQDQLRLQLAMDRYSKIMSTLSSLMQKKSDTSSAILGNMK